LHGLQVKKKHAFFAVDDPQEERGAFDMIKQPANQYNQQGDGRTKYTVHQRKVIADQRATLYRSEKKKKEKEEKAGVGFVKRPDEQFVKHLPHTVVDGWFAGEFAGYDMAFSAPVPGAN
jgi:hypothetical protein